MKIRPKTPIRTRRRSPRSLAASVAIAALPAALHAQQATTLASADKPDEPSLQSVQVTGNWLGTGLQDSVKTFAGARTVVDKTTIDNSGATSIGDVMRRIPGVQSTDNSGTAGSAISLNIGVRGLTGRYSPRSTVLLDGIPLAVAPYGQPQLSFAPVSLANIESIDVVRGAGAVRYGPQNVGGIINFNTRAIPRSAALTGDAGVRYNDYGHGGGTTQYDLFLGKQFDSGIGVALLYSGMTGSEWRKASDETVNDVAIKFRLPVGDNAEIYGKLSHYDVTSRTPGGLTVAQYKADPFQNTRPTDFWSGDRSGIDLGYVNTLSSTQEFEIRTYYNDSFRQSTLSNTAATQLTYQPRNYRVLGIEPRYTQRFVLGATTQDVTAGYRFIRERGDDNSAVKTIASGVFGAMSTFDNDTDAHAGYIDDRIAFGRWRVTPGVRFEHIASTRHDVSRNADFNTVNNQFLPSINVAYVVNDAWTLFANYGTSFGPVQNIQLNSQTASNPLKPELARTKEVGTRWKDGQLSAELTAFQLRFDNQILQLPGVTPATFANIGATHHKGIESAIAYDFDEQGPLAGLSVYANYTVTDAVQASGATAGRDVPFYSHDTDTEGLRYVVGAWGFDLSSTHQTAQFSDTANTVAESANGGVGRVPGFRLWNAQLSWKAPLAKSLDLRLGVNNIADKRYYTRNVDGNAGRMVGAPRTVYVQGRLAF